MKFILVIIVRIFILMKWKCLLVKKLGKVMDYTDKLWQLLIFGLFIVKGPKFLKIRLLFGFYI